MANYVLEGPRWGTGAVGTGGGTVSWAVDSTVSGGFTSQIGAAFADWTSRANIAFKQVASTASAQITFSLKPIDGLNKVLGTTDYTYSGQRMLSAAVTLDSGEGWHASGNQIVSNDAVNFFVVAVHEIGHALGLDHYNSGQAVMNAIIDRSVTDLTGSDIAGIQALYGAPATVSATVAPTVSATPMAFGTIQYTASGTGGAVYGLYKALLGRVPDALGLASSAAALANGAPPAAVAASILGSGEYAAKNASPLSDAAYVSSLYTNVLNRAPDAQGQSFFLNELGAGVNRATVAAQIATSNEAQALLQSTFTAGVAVPDAANAQVARLFYGVLGRAPDSKGLAYFSSIEKSAGAAGIAQMMLSSPEFVKSYGTLSDAGYVDSLYMGALGRHADASALSYWGGQVSGLGRAQVAAQIAQSQEAQVHLVGVIEQGMHLMG
jgi:hypothetical protein